MDLPMYPPIRFACNYNRRTGIVNTYPHLLRLVVDGQDTRDFLADNLDLGQL